LSDEEYPGRSQAVYTRRCPPFSMDDLVVTGALGLIGLYLAAVILLFTIFFVGRLMYSSLEAGDFGVVIGGIIGILIVVSLYIAIGFWLRKTDRI
jgi:hypothetical protein